MRWYDYLACIMLADWIARPLMDMFAAENIWQLIFYAIAAYGGWVLFEWYAEYRVQQKM